MLQSNRAAAEAAAQEDSAAEGDSAASPDETHEGTVIDPEDNEAAEVNHDNEDVYKRQGPGGAKRLRRTPQGAPCASFVCGFKIPHSLPQVHRLRESDGSPGWERFAFFGKEPLQIEPTTISVSYTHLYPRCAP